MKWTEALTACEWATAIWVAVAVIAMAFRRDLRQHMLTIINVWRSPTLAVPVSLMLAYVAAVVRGGPRYTLDGTEDGQVSEQNRAVASSGNDVRPLSG